MNEHNTTQHNQFLLPNRFTTKSWRCTFQKQSLCEMLLFESLTLLLLDVKQMTFARFVALRSLYCSFFQVKATFSVTLSVFCMVYEIFTMSSTKAISTSSAVVEFHFQIKPMLSVTLALVSEFAMIFELFAVSSIILALFFTVHAVQQGVLLQLFSSKAHVCLISFSVCLRRVLGSQASRPLQSPAVCRAQPTCWHWK